MVVETKVFVALLLGGVLLSAPVLGPVLDVTGTDYVYDATEVTAEDGRISVETTRGQPSPTDQIACMSEFAAETYDRGCYLESGLREGNTTVTYPADGSDTVGTPIPEYVVFGAEGVPYRRQTASEGNETTLALQRVPPEEALSAVASRPMSDPGAERIIEQGRTEVDSPLPLGPDHNEIYEYEDGYVAVFRLYETQGLSEKPAVERGLEGLAVLLGGAALFVAGRMANDG